MDIKSISGIGKVLLLLTTCVLGTCCSSQDDQMKCEVSKNNSYDTFHSYLKYFEGSYTLIVEMTDLKRNVAYHVTEVRQRETLNGVTENNGTVYLSQNGKDMILSYFPKTNAVVESSDNSCRVTSIRNFPEIFWGWNQLAQRSEDIIIGPAALIRRFLTSNQMQRLQNGERGRHGSEFDIWEACEEDGEVKLLFYLPVAPHTNDVTGMLNFHFEVIFMDGSERFHYAVKRYYQHFVPSSVPGKLACTERLRKNGLPKVPEQFSYWQEIVELSYFEDSISQRRIVDNMRVTHSQQLGLTRMDLNAVSSHEEQSSENLQESIIKDSITGMSYSINKKFRNCTKTDPSKNAIKFSYDTAQLLLLDESFSISEETNARDINCDLWTSMVTDFPDVETGGFQSHPKVELQICFTKANYGSPAAEDEFDTPIKSDLILYDSGDAQKVVKRITTNFYDFRPITGFPEEDFSFSECLRRKSEKHDYKLISTDTRDNGNLDPEHKYTSGDMAGVACGMILLGIMMTASFLVIIVLTGPKNFPTEKVPQDMVRVSYLNLRSRSAQGESES